MHSVAVQNFTRKIITHLIITTLKENLAKRIFWLHSRPHHILNWSKPKLTPPLSFGPILLVPFSRFVVSPFPCNQTIPTITPKHIECKWWNSTKRSSDLAREGRRVRLWRSYPIFISKNNPSSMPKSGIKFFFLPPSLSVKLYLCSVGCHLLLSLLLSTKMVGGCFSLLPPLLVPLGGPTNSQKLAYVGKKGRELAS